MNKKSVLMSLAIICFAIIANAQKTNVIFPKTPAAVVSGFYNDLSQKKDGIARETIASAAFDKYFDKSYTELGGKGNKAQNFDQFKAFVTGTFKQLPNLTVEVEELISSGDMVTVKIKLSDDKANVVINYLALYYVSNGKIKSRYAYSDGAF